MNNMCEKKPVTVILGNHGKVIEKLTEKGIRCVILEDNGDIDFSVRNHADMSAYMLSGGKILLDKRQKKAAKELESLGFTVCFIEENICGAYPDDILLNAAKVGSKVICLKKHISEEIISDAEEIISVRQGYSKCSVCVVNDNAIITDDRGIYEKCKNVFDVLLVSKGDILLENQNYGFIGGASSKIGGKICFFGSLENHRDGEKIKEFLKKHNTAYECLFEGELIDIGGALEVFSGNNKE